MIDETWFETTGKMLLSNFCLAFEQRMGGGAMKRDPNRESRLRIHDIIDQNCKNCTKVAGLRGSNRSQDWSKSREICSACSIGQELQRLSKPLWSVSEERRYKSVGEGEIEKEGKKPMAPRTRDRGKVVPAKKASVETSSSGHGHVKTYKMSPEELEDYRARTGYKALAMSEPVKKPIAINLEEHEVKIDNQAEQKRRDKRVKEGPDNGKKKVDFLKGIAAGKSVSAVEKEWGMKYGTLTYWVGKWSLRGITPGNARKLLAKMGEDQHAEEKGTQQEAVRQSLDAVLPTDGSTGADLASQDVAGEPKGTGEAAADVGREEALVAEIEQLKQKLNDLQTIRYNATEAHTNVQSKMQEEIERLKADNAELISEVADKEREIAALVTVRSTLIAEIDELNATIDKLQDAQNQPVQTAPVAQINYPFSAVTLTYALIDFGGDAISQRLKVLEEANELIDEVEPANIDLTRTVAELYDAGQAFVGLIRKKLQELCVDDADGHVRRYFELHNQRHLEKMALKLKESSKQEAS